MLTGFSCPSKPQVGRTTLSVAGTANLPQPEDVGCRSNNGPPNLDRNIIIHISSYTSLDLYHTPDAGCLYVLSLLKNSDSCKNLMKLILEDFVFCYCSVRYCVIYRLWMSGGCLSCGVFVARGTWNCTPNGGGY